MFRVVQQTRHLPPLGCLGSPEFGSHAETRHSHLIGRLCRAGRPRSDHPSAWQPEFSPIKARGTPICRDLQLSPRVAHSILGRVGSIHLLAPARQAPSLGVRGAFFAARGYADLLTPPWQPRVSSLPGYEARGFYQVATATHTPSPRLTAPPVGHSMPCWAGPNLSTSLARVGAPTPRRRWGSPLSSYSLQPGVRAFQGRPARLGVFQGLPKPPASPASG